MFTVSEIFQKEPKLDISSGVFDEENIESPWKLRIVAQCCALSVPNILTLSLGLCFGYSTILIAELYKEDAEINLTLAEITWMSSVSYFMVPVSALVSGPLSDQIGRRPMMLLSGIVCLTGWLIFHWIRIQVWLLIVALAMLGISGGIVSKVGLSYSKEISDPELQTAASISLSITPMLGCFLQVLLGNFLHWRSLALINVAVSVLGLVGVCLIPESPVWCRSKNRDTESAKALWWLRGWSNSSYVKAECALNRKMSTSSPFNSMSSYPYKASERYLQRPVLLPLILLIFSFIVAAFNGSIAFITYAVIIFERIESPMNKYTAATILIGLQVLALFLLLGLVKRIGKRKLTIASLIVSTAGFFIISMYASLKHRGSVKQYSNYDWIPVLLVMIVTFAQAGGIKNTPWLIMGELFAPDVRGFAISLVTTVSYIMSALANKTFIYIFDALGISGSCFLLACINLIGFIVLYSAMPETEGKTLVEIGRHFSKKNKPELTENSRLWYY